ncbi:hypothetical protein [Streptomyces sp. NPDC048282]|uniref:hypothetical protein n=1 Tax=Streptomyces sp. NPDC048282 TaxID=3365528 RepID=UPI003712084E
MVRQIGRIDRVGKQRHDLPRRLAETGHLPERDAREEEIDRRTRQLLAIPGPVTAEEAEALVACFAPDDCHGVARTLLHLIDTGPNPVLTTRPDPDANKGHHRLYHRSVFDAPGPTT